MIEVGKKAPAFRLASDLGDEVSLKDLAGKTVVLFFYPKDMTSGCTKEACDFNDSLPKFKKKGVEVLGVSKDSIDSHKKFRAKYGLKFPLLSDESLKTLEAFGVWKEKSLYGRKFMGIERTTVIIGPDGKVKKVYPKVKVPGHVADVLKEV